MSTHYATQWTVETDVNVYSVILDLDAREVVVETEGDEATWVISFDELDALSSVLTDAVYAVRAAEDLD